MAYKRILTIQDISCIGQCSMTVALPVLSSWGHETCILPTMVLSTHTGGFGKPEILSLGSCLEGFWRHWEENQIRFDGILTGYLGSIEAIDTASTIIDRFLNPDGICIVDPAMADNGKLYSGFDHTYASAMASLCQKADWILPNVTEAAILADSRFEEQPQNLLRKLDFQRVILTGIECEEMQMEILWKDGTDFQTFRHPRIGGRFSGTGDLFASCFAGAILCGMSDADAIRKAAELTQKCVQNTQQAPSHSYGIRFASILPDICQYAKSIL